MLFSILVVNSIWVMLSICFILLGVLVVSGLVGDFVSWSVVIGWVMLNEGNGVMVILGVLVVMMCRMIDLLVIVGIMNRFVM